MNFLMFMALLFVAWDPSILRDLADPSAAEAARPVEQPVATSSDPGNPDENQTAAAQPPNSSRSFAFSTPTREWLRTNWGNASCEHLLLPGSACAPAYVPTLAFGPHGHTALLTSARLSRPHCGRAPPLAT